MIKKVSALIIAKENSANWRDVGRAVRVNRCNRTVNRRSLALL
ncbi:hypothetical protein D777_00191 [Marinobacter nitratireducens]|uniref:Uncharacterized protein n=1 Tax=Marinobacter nitratireducens TaxID=1137280 RepID=A0A072N890_9GAMM|nr:hypothetical protein D777_00191 [Marinobacter nitratireducens]